MGLSLNRVWHILMARYAYPKSRECIFCGNACARFLPYRNGLASLPALLQSLDFVGSDMEQFSCAHCGSTDRERHLWMYMKSTSFLSHLRGARVLHFAPESLLSQKLKEQNLKSYIQADLVPTSREVVPIDIENIDLPDGCIDIIIANHVLEHVSDDRKAIFEIYRVLASAGHAIIQTPFCQGLHHSWSDTGISNEEQRFNAFGQEDHVRLYGADIFDRLCQSGLVPLIKTHAECMPDRPAGRYGVNEQEPFFLFQKQSSSVDDVLS